ncbi:MAG: AAA family ATPase [Chloroflexi bacterium]|nr:AAA family ATPase [Chloroflexota bacterium]
MKVVSALIENFRHIEQLELDFTDSVGRVRDVSVIVGPNTSGKTTVLDALAIGLGQPTELPYSRPDFVLTPRVVRRGALQTRVTCKVRFSPEEIAATRELYALSEEDQKIPDVDEVSVSWEYPYLRDRQKYPRGYARFDPYQAWRLFKGRVKVARLLPTSRVDWSWFERVGGVFTFDQQRTGMGKVIPRDIWDIIHENGNGVNPDERRTADPRTILLALAVQSLVPSVDKRQLDQFKRIQERYAEICAPHRIERVERDELEQMQLVFTDGTYEYRYDGLSSGEQMLLLFLIRMVTEHVHQSIVLVDEVELHQHPLWQRKLLYLLPRIGQNNQIIATTHSAYLRDALPREAILRDLGELGDRSRSEEDHR